MGSGEDSWEQLSALERRASRTLNVQQPASSQLEQAFETSEVSTSTSSDSNENFQARINKDYYRSLIC